VNNVESLMRLLVCINVNFDIATIIVFLRVEEV